MVRSGGVGRAVVVVVVVVVVVGAAVVVVALVVVVRLVVLAAVELLLLLLLLLLLPAVGLLYRRVVVSGKRLVGSVADGVVVSTIWKVTNLLGTVVVSMRCSKAGPVVSIGRVVVVRRRCGFTVVVSLAS